MDGRLLLVVILAVVSLGLAQPWESMMMDDCPKCLPVRPIRDFDEEKVSLLVL